MAIAVTGQAIDLAPDHALFGEVSSFLAGDVCSLPFQRRDRVHWVTFGGTASKFRDAIDTLRAWLMPSQASEDAHAIVSSASGDSRLSSELLALSSHGYYRWQSGARDVEKIARKLRQIRALDSRRPIRTMTRSPTLLELRRRYNVEYLTGNWKAAEESVKLIDALQLDTALNTAQMRIRIWGAGGEWARIVQSVEHGRLLDLKMPGAIQEVILQAYAQTTIAPLEEAGSLAEAAELYRTELHARLAGLIVENKSTSSIELQRLAAYRAWADKDWTGLAGVSRESSDVVLVYLRQFCPRLDPQLVESADLTNRPTRWPDVVSIVRSGRLTYLDEFLERNASIDELRRPGESEACATALYDLYFDNEIAADSQRRKARDRILMQVIDSALCDAEFPIRDCEKLYRELLELWVLEYGSSSYPPYGQLVLSLADGLLTMSATNESLVVNEIKAWWSARPANARLGWLLEAVDSLSMHVASKMDIDGIWVAGVGLVKRDPSVVSRVELKLWRQLGSRLGFPQDSIDDYLPIDSDQADVRDLLAEAGLKKIAIVTLQERAGRAARDQLIERTGADVFVVSSHVADEATAAAAESDLVLFVWSATKHAVLRAFDGARDKLQFVQGTGPASIVLAAERWASEQRERKRLLN